MKRLMLKHKLILIAMTTCVSALIFAGASIIVWEWGNYKEVMAAYLSSQADLIAAAVTSDQPKNGGDILNALAADKNIIMGCIYKNNGEVFAYYLRDNNTGLIKQTGPLKNGYGFENGFLVASKHILLEGKIVGTVYLKAELTNIYKMLYRNITIISLVLIVAAIVAYQISSRLQKVISRPILNLTSVAKEVSIKKEYSIRAKVTSNDEVGVLVESFNEMLSQIQQGDKALIEANEILEHNVTERTAELSKINEMLVKEVAERKLGQDNLKIAKEETEQANIKLKLQIEKANLMAKEAVRASQAKSQFLANMSHEIRTPMHAIIGFSDILKEMNLKAEAEKYINIIAQSGANLLSLINDILDFAKIEAGQLRTEVIEFNLNVVTQEIMIMLSPAAAKKKLDFRFIEKTEIPDIITNDPARIRQCLINLINNAVKFTESGHVYVYLSVEIINNIPHLRFDVEDTGIGIPQDKLESIFESFTQADGTHTRKYGGTGLGLAITKQLSQLLGGDIKVKSRIGKGSVFSFHVPVNKKMETSPEHKDPSAKTDEPAYNVSKNEDVMKNNAQNQTKGRILVAEDSPNNQLLIRVLLKKMGYEPYIVNNGEEVIVKVLSDEFDAVLMDMHMPVLNGIEATRQLRQHGCKIPIIALTANAMQGDDKICLSAGCDDYLAKPLNIDKLKELLDKYIDRERESDGFTADNLNMQIDQIIDLFTENKSVAAGDEEISKPLHSSPKTI